MGRSAVSHGASVGRRPLDLYPGWCRRQLKRRVTGLIDNVLWLALLQGFWLGVSDPSVLSSHEPKRGEAVVFFLPPSPTVSGSGPCRRRPLQAQRATSSAPKARRASLRPGGKDARRCWGATDIVLRGLNTGLPPRPWRHVHRHGVGGRLLLPGPVPARAGHAPGFQGATPQ